MTGQNNSTSCKLTNKHDNAESLKAEKKWHSYLNDLNSKYTTIRIE